MPESIDDTQPGDSPSEARGGAVALGTVIGRYVVLARLGAGAMGVVLAAYDPELDRKIALKLLDARWGAESGLRARLQREAQALARLDHPNVVAVHDVGVHDEQLFVGMEYVDGQTLGTWMKAAEQPRPWPDVLRVFIEAGRGLAAAHAANLIHRDFKPDNVMIGRDGRVRVMDFGLVRHADDVDEHESREHAPDDSRNASMLGPSAELTQTGAMMGTPAYMAAEQFGEGEVDERSDQFSFCVALYEALYGERPFGGASLSELFLAVSDAAIREPPKGARVPSWLRKVVVRGLAADKQARWPSMVVLLDALADDPARHRRRRAALGLIAGMVASVGFGIWDAVERDAHACTGMDARLVGV